MRGAPLFLWTVLLAVGPLATWAGAQEEEPPPPRPDFRLRVRAVVARAPAPDAEAAGARALRFRGHGGARVGEAGVGIALRPLEQAGDGDGELAITFDNPLAWAHRPAFAGRGRAVLTIGDRTAEFRVRVLGEIRRTRDGRRYMVGRFRSVGGADGDRRIRGRFSGPAVRAEETPAPDDEAEVANGT